MIGETTSTTAKIETPKNVLYLAFKMLLLTSSLEIEKQSKNQRTYLKSIA